MNQWRQFFDSYATQYDDEVFTKNTAAEVEFLIKHLDLQPGERVLDLGCGTGRHSVPLAERGLHMTGVDLSSGMLDVARARASGEGVEVEWVQQDATAFTRPGAFDAAICLCEGALCLYDAEQDTDDHDLKIFANIHASLRPGGRLLLNVLSACRQIRRFSDDDVAAGRFDPLTLTEQSDVPGADPDTLKNLRERGYTAPELRRVLTWSGFRVAGIYGGTAGDWGLRPLKLDEYELMAIATKP